MKKVVILGAGGNIAGHVIDLLVKKPDLHLTLFLRHARRLGSKDMPNCRLVEGDVLNLGQLKAAVSRMDIVYANLSGDLGQMAKNIVQVMKSSGVKRLIFISCNGIYATPLKPALQPHRAAADFIEGSDLDFTILRPALFTSDEKVDFEITQKGTPEKGSVVSQKSLAAFIAQIIVSPEKYVRENLGINKPN